MVITRNDLKQLFDRVLKKLEEDQVKSIEFDEDYYLKISVSER